ncbi:UDP-2,3-diacylglucosamine diphosphatase [Ekhidna sp.]
MKVPELISSFKELPSDKKLYFASDFHLGAPNEKESLEREKKIIRWLEHVSKDASAIFLVGDIFDFWFEYHTTIPKGFIRFQGKLAELVDQGITIVLFVGNHDLWMDKYFPSQLGIPVYKKPVSIEVMNTKIFVGHGDGLGPGDRFFKFAKSVFTNSFFQWLFQWLHPNVGVSIAKYWSKKSRESSGHLDEAFKGDDEPIWQFCKSMNDNLHHDYYILGHRHLPLELEVSENSKYFNLGEWINQCSYLEFDGNHAVLKNFEG